ARARTAAAAVAARRPRRGRGTEPGVSWVGSGATTEESPDIIPARHVMSTFILADMLHGDVRARPWDVAVLPFGATEPHNLHMPYGTDTLQVEEIGRRACDYATQAGARVVLLPALPFGINTNHLKVPGALACSLTP